MEPVIFNYISFVCFKGTHAFLETSPTPVLSHSTDKNPKERWVWRGKRKGISHEKCPLGKKKGNVQTGMVVKARVLVTPPTPSHPSTRKLQAHSPPLVHYRSVVSSIDSHAPRSSCGSLVMLILAEFLRPKLTLDFQLFLLSAALIGPPADRRL